MFHHGYTPADLLKSTIASIPTYNKAYNIAVLFMVRIYGNSTLLVFAANLAI